MPLFPPHRSIGWPCRAVLLFLLVMTTVPVGQLVQAQGHYVDHGFFISSGLSYRTSRSTVTWNATYFIRGTVEVGGQLYRFDDTDSGIVTVGVVGLAGIYPFQQSDRWPVTMRLVGKVHPFNLGGDVITELQNEGYDPTGIAYWLGTSISRQIRTSRRIAGLRVDLVPLVEVAYHTRTLDLGPRTETPTYWTVALELATEVHVADYTSVMLIPRIGWLDEELGVGLTLGWTGGYLR